MSKPNDHSSNLLTGSSTARIRPADLSDEPELLVIINQAYLIGERGIVLEPFQRATPNELRSMIPSLLVLETSACQVVGCIKVEVRDDRTGFLGCLAVSIQHQGLGHGTILMEAGEAVLKEMGCSVVRLDLLTPRTWKHDHKERLRSWYTNRLGYDLIVPGDEDASTTFLAKGTLLGEAELAIDAGFTAYSKTVK